ncbi:MAG: tetratricopeptide repeat protein [Eubacterium sp.]
MTENEIVQEIDKYRKKDKYFNVIFITVLFCTILLMPKIWLKVVLSFAVFIIALFVSLKIDKSKHSILIYKMEPQAYYAVYHSSRYSKVNGDEDIEIAYFIGDYNKVISLVEDKKKKAGEKGKKLNNVPNCLYLCLSYFEIGDFENAHKSIDYFKSLFEGKRTNEILELSYFSQLDFIENFIDGRYDKCIAIEDVKSKLPDKAMGNTFKARMDYYSALAYYYNGDMNTAKQYFDSVIDFCPHLNYARLAENHIDRITNEY